MPVYPQVTLNGFLIPSADRRFNLYSESPVRQVSVPLDSSVPGQGGHGRVLYTQNAYDFPLFSVKVLIWGQPSGTRTPDSVIADVEKSYDNLAQLCSLPLTTIKWEESSSKALFAKATIVSINREESPRDHALVTVVFRLTTPFWRQWYSTNQDVYDISHEVSLTTNGGRNITLPFTGSAPILSPRITLTGPCTKLIVVDGANATSGAFPFARSHGSGEGFIWQGSLPPAATLTFTLSDEYSGFGAVTSLPITAVTGGGSPGSIGFFSLRSGVNLARRFQLTPIPLDNLVAFPPVVFTHPDDWRVSVGVYAEGVGSPNTKIKFEGFKSFR